MKIGRIIRERMAEEIKQCVESRGNTFVISYSGVNGFQMNQFRKNLEKIGSQVFVSRNTIAQLALKELSYEKLAEKISGQTAFIWSDADSVEISKILIKFGKEREGVVVQGGILDGNFIGADEVKRLADLPSREILLTMLAATIQSPLTRLASALNGKTRELIYLLKQLSEQKGGS